MKLLAHLTEINGLRQEQTLQEHCIKTAEYAGESLGKAGFYNTAYVAGLLHDMGKATLKYNSYLGDAFQGKQGIKGSVNHTFAGVIYMLERYHGGSSMEKLACEIICYAIGAHHGEFDCVDLDGKNGFLHRLQKDRVELCYEEAVQNYFDQVIDEEKIDQIYQKAVKEVQKFYEKTVNEWKKKQKKVFFQISMLTRLVLSSVIYGDRRDTGEFMKQTFFVQENVLDWQTQRSYLERKLLHFDLLSEINRVRSDISRQCLTFAKRSGGIYRLNVPTGAGKTLCSLRYALAHAQEFNKERIIFIIPLLSVLDQNAKVIRENILDSNAVLEHHSNVIHEIEKKEELDRYEVLTDNWQSSIVISTLVQLLNILFSHQTSSIGRMRALCNSVIIIDEIQSLPKRITAMFNMAMNFLSNCCNTTIILSSATQPCFEELDWPIRFAESPDMVTLSPQQLQVFQRADIIDKTNPYGMDWDECIYFLLSLMDDQDCVLVICNTKKEARILYEKIQKETQDKDWNLFHLSTAMCQKHRMDVMELVQKELLDIEEGVRANRKVNKLICFSTQLVEAGVDFSFQSVVRVLAGIDNLAQSAGRCNRSNEYGYPGKVYLINLKNEHLNMLPDIVRTQDATRKVLEDKEMLGQETLIEEIAIQKYYRALFQLVKEEIKYPVKEYGDTIYLTELLANNNKYATGEINRKFYFRQPFKTIGQKFKVFEKDTIDILVPYREGIEIIDEIKKSEEAAFASGYLKKLMQRAKLYTISIYEEQKTKLWEAGLLKDTLEGRIYILDEKVYHKKYGLYDFQEQPVENYIL